MKLFGGMDKNELSRETGLEMKLVDKYREQSEEICIVTYEKIDLPNLLKDNELFFLIQKEENNFILIKKIKLKNIESIIFDLKGDLQKFSILIFIKCFDFVQPYEKKLLRVCDPRRYFKTHGSRAPNTVARGGSEGSRRRAQGGGRRAQRQDSRQHVRARSHLHHRRDGVPRPDASLRGRRSTAAHRAAGTPARRTRPGDDRSRRR